MARSEPALELKGRMLSATRIRVLKADSAAIDAQLTELARSMPPALKGMAAVIESDLPVDLAALIHKLRNIGMQPLGVVDGPLAAAAGSLGLAVLPRGAEGKRDLPAPAPAAAAPQPPSLSRPARLQVEPVRSGQQIYAEGSDLIVLAPVSPGAEVIADGCVHVYAPLRGRAIAGARGDTNARIFCRNFESELVAVAGIYAVADQMKDAPRGKAAQVLLKNGQLVIEPLAH